MKIRRIYSVLAAVLAAGMLCGCTGKTAVPSRESAAPAAAVQTAEPSAEPAEEIPVEQAMARLPDAEAFTNDFFGAVNSFHPGTAGSSLGRAAAACRVLEFASSWDLKTPDGAYAEAVVNSLKTSWAGLSAEDQGTFAENWQGLSELISGTLSDFESNKGVYEDAGVLDSMQALLADPENTMKCWNALYTVVGKELTKG